MNKDRFIIVPINKYGNRVYDKLDDKFLSLEQILDLLNDYEVLCSTLWSDFNEQR